MTSNVVDSALAETLEDRAYLLLAAHEDQWFERKSARVEPKKLAAAICAFANAEGGTVVIGLSEGNVEGIDELSKIAKNNLRQTHIDHIEPPVRAEYSEVTCLNADGIPRTLLVVDLQPSELVHQTKDATCYLRVGDESVRLTFDQRRELVYDKNSSQYESEVVDGANFEELDHALLQNYSDAISASQDLPSLLRNRGLATRDGQITVAGYLLFGKEPAQRFPNAHIRIIKFHSDDRGTGSRLNVDGNHDYRVEGPIPKTVMQALAIMRKIVPVRRHLGDEGLFEDHPLIPEAAWLEGIVNAAVHRSYSLAGDHIRIEVFPTRIEFHSPGRFPGIVNLSNAQEIDRYARNPRIARVCADLRIGQELGEGIKRIYEEMRRVGLTDPIYTQTRAKVQLTLQAVNRILPAVLERLPPWSQDVLDALRQAGGESSTGDLAKALERTKPTVTTRLKALEKENLVEWVGQSPRDPRAIWRIV